MVDLIIIAIIVIILTVTIRYIVKEKKNGAKCIGCPSGKTCGGSCGSQCHCEEYTETK